MRTLQPNQNEFQLLLKALGYLRTHWWLLLIELVLMFGYNVALYMRTKPTYQSSAALLIDNSKSRLYRSYLLGGQGSNNHQKRNLVHLLNSHEVYERFKNNLTEYYNEEGRPRYLRNFFPEGGLPTNTFREHITLHWDAKSDIYNIACTGPNPDAAHAICLNYMNTVHDYYPELGHREDMMKREFLTRQIASETRIVGEREAAVANFQKTNSEFMDFLAEGGKDKLPRMLRERLRKLQNEIDDNRALRELLLNVPAAKRGEHSSLRTAIDTLTKQIQELSYEIQLTEQSIDPNSKERLATLNEQIAQASSRLAALNERETNLYLKTPIQAEDVRKQVAKLEFEYRVKLTSVRRATNDLAEANRKIRQFQPLFLEYERLNTEIRHHRGLLESLFRREQRTELELSAGQAEIFRLREPSRNQNRIAPFISRFLYRAASLSLFLIAVTVVLLMALVPRLDSESEVSRLNLPVIGKIPKLGPVGRSIDDIPSFGLEHLKIMHYRILRETKDVKCPIVIVTSANAKEGKSTVVHSLAITSQSQTRRTLLIDGDLLTLHPYKFAGIQEDQTAGMKSIILDSSPPPLDEIIVKTTIDGVSFMPRGERVEPTDLPHHLRMVEATLKQLREQYDLILIDTPPLFAANLAHQWSGLADIIVLVARFFVTRPSDVVEAIQTCKIFSKAPVGVALNCVPTTTAHRKASNYYFSRKKVKTNLAA